MTPEELRNLLREPIKREIEYCQGFNCSKIIHSGTSDCKISKWNNGNPTFLCLKCYTKFEAYIIRKKREKKLQMEEEKKAKKIKREMDKQMAKMKGQTLLINFSDNERDNF